MWRRSVCVLLVAVISFLAGFSLCMLSQRFLSSADTLKTGWELQLDAFSKESISDVERLSRLAIYEWYVARLVRDPSADGKAFCDSLIKMHIVKHISLEALGLPDEANKEWLAAREMFGAEGGEDVLFKLKKAIIEQRESR